MFVEKNYQLEHVRLAVKEWVPENESDDETPYLALHGWLDNAASFDLLVSKLNQNHWYSVDVTGHGDSQHKPKGSFYYLWELAADIVDLINKMNLSSVNLIGHSMGGAVAFIVAALAPDRINKLVVLDNLGAFTIESDARVTRLQNAIKSRQKISTKKTSSKYPEQNNMIEARMYGFTELNYEAAKKLVLRGSEIDPNGGYRWKHDPQLLLPTPFPMDQQSLNTFISSIKCPILILLANGGIYKESGDKVLSMTDEFRQIEIKWLKGGHHFHLEDESFESVAIEIDNFVYNKNKENKVYP